MPGSFISQDDRASPAQQRWRCRKTTDMRLILSPDVASRRGQRFQDHEELTANSTSTTIIRVNSSGAAMPPEVQELQDAITSIPGITDAAVDKVDLSDVTESDFSLLPYADLPLGALKRTKEAWSTSLPSPSTLVSRAIRKASRHSSSFPGGYAIRREQASRCRSGASRFHPSAISLARHFAFASIIFTLILSRISASYCPR